MRSICVIVEQTFGLILHHLFIKTHRLHFWWFPIFICIPLNRFILLFFVFHFSLFLFHFDHHLNLFTWNSFTFFCSSLLRVFLPLLHFYFQFYFSQLFWYLKKFFLLCTQQASILFEVRERSDRKKKSLNKRRVWRW